MNIELIGQEKPFEIISQALNTGRISGTYLFTGPKGVGKYSTARLMAAALFCGEKRFPPCCTCAQCKKVEHYNHPDVVYVSPRGAEIRIDDVREATRLLSYKPFEGGCKIAIIDEAEKLRREAANALLKTLEEPPPGTVIILVASSTSALLPTIVSRSQIIRFNAVSKDKIAAFLTSAKGLEEKDAELIAELSGGSPGSALSLLENYAPSFLRELASRLFSALNGDMKARMDVAEEISGKRETMVEALSFLQTISRLAVEKTDDSNERTIWLQRLDRIKQAEGNLKFHTALQLTAEAMFLSMP